MTIGNHPLSLHVYSIVHFFERFSYYGILSLLVLYLSTKLNFSDARSYAVMGVYGTLTYATPLLGGYIADKFIGFYAALWVGLSFIMMGHLSIYGVQSELGLFLGLGLVATGSGFYKSNMNALIGNLYGKDSLLKDAAYTIFYVYQNAGAFVAPVICGYIGLTYGWSYGFSLAGLAGVGALTSLYFAGKFKRARHSFAPPLKWKKLMVILLGGFILAAVLALTVYHGEDTLDLLLGLSFVYFLIYLKHIYSVPRSERGKMLVIGFGIIAVALSGALINYGGTVFTIFMSRNIDPSFFSLTVPVTFIQSIDPITIVLFGPLLAILWKAFSNKGHHIPGIIKVLMGFGFIVIAYGYLYELCAHPDESNFVGFIPFVVGLALMASADILIYPNVLTFCSRLTPKGLTGVVMGFIVFGMSLSQLFGTYLAKLASLHIEEEEDLDRLTSLIHYQGFFSTMTIVSLITLIVLSLFVWLIYKKKNKYES